MSNQIVISSGAKVRNLNGVLTGTSGVVDALGINVPSGIPQLDGSGKILVSQLPNSVMEYKGTWNAATNTPTLVNGTGNQGDVYLCNVAGTVNFGDGPITFSVGDQVIYSGTIWQRASGATGTVTSVAVTESGDALTITGSPITTSGTINIGFAGTSGQYVNGAGGLTTFPSLTGYVPYTGATTNVNLGEFGLTSGFVGFDLTPTGTPTGVGTLSWDSAYRTLQLIDGDGDTTLQIGQEQRALIHNNTGATLTDGQVVYVTGSTGNLPTVALASNTLEASSSVTFGVVTESIAHGADGFVTISGTVNGLDTLAFNEGDALYLGSTAGTFTNVKPVAPANLVLIGYMIKKAGGNGSIFVKIQNGYELEELHDVLVTSVANNQGLFWDSATSLWKNNTIAGVLGYTPANAATYVPYSGATQNVNLGVYNIELGAVLTNKTANGGLLMKQNTTISAEVSGTNYTSIKPFDTRYLYFDFGQPSSYKSFRIDANGLTNATLRTYTLPDASGTIALTSDLSAYLPLTGGTLTGDLSIDKSSASLFLKSATGGSNSIGFLVNGVSVGGITVTSTFYQFNNNTSYGYLFKNAAGNNLLSIQDSGAAVFLGSVSATIGDFSSWVKSTGYRLDGMTAGSGALYYNSVENRVTLANYNSGGILNFEVNGGTYAMRINANGNIGIGTTSPLSFTNYTTTQISNTSGAALFVESTSGGILGQLIADNGYSSPAVILGARSNHPVVFTTNNAEKMRITTGGNVGIGTSSPGQKLDVFGRTRISNPSNSAQFLEIYTDSGSVYYNAQNNSIQNTAFQHIFYTDGVSPTERMRITSSGNVGIGTSIPNRQLEVMSTEGGILRLSRNDGSVTTDESIGTLEFHTNDGDGPHVAAYVRGLGADLPGQNFGRFGALAFGVSLTANQDAVEVMRINLSGQVGIGITNPSFQLQLSTDSAAKPTSALWTIASDIRIKENITPYKKGLNELMQINPINYDYNGLGGFKKGKGGVGIIAQEILEVLPDSVNSYSGKINVEDEDETEILNFNGHELMYLLINSIKEQQAQIEELKALIAAK